MMLVVWMDQKCKIFLLEWNLENDFLAGKLSHRFISPEYCDESYLFGLGRQ